MIEWWAEKRNISTYSVLSRSPSVVVVGVNTHFRHNACSSWRRGRRPWLPLCRHARADGTRHRESLICRGRTVQQQPVWHQHQVGQRGGLPGENVLHQVTTSRFITDSPWPPSHPLIMPSYCDHTHTLRFNGHFSRWTWVSRLPP